MKKITTTCIGLLLFSAAAYPLTAQEKETETVEVNIEITKDGKTETIIKEFEVPAGMENMVWNFEEDVEDGRVVIRKHTSGESGDFWKHMQENVEAEKVAFLGVKGYTINKDADGPKSVRVTSIIAGEAAEKAGLQNEDIIESIDGKSLETYPQLVELIRSKNPGDNITIEVNRAGKMMEFTATLGEKEQPDWSHFKHMEQWKDGGDMEKVEVIVIKQGHELTGDDKKRVEDATGISPSGENSFDDVQMEIFPNPAEDVISYKLGLEEGGKLELLLIDPNGKVLQKDKLNSSTGEYEGEIKLEGKPSGNYLLVFKQGDRLLTEKIMKR